MYSNHQNGLIDLRYSCYKCTAIHFYISNFIFFQHFTMSGKRYSSQAEWAKSQFKFEPHEGKGGKWRCIHEVDDPTAPNKKRRCSQTYGQATNKCNWVQHLRREHGLELPLNLQQKQEILQNNKQLTVAPLFAKQANKTSVQMERLVVAYAMNLRVAFDTMDNKHWKLAHQASYVPGLKTRKDLVEQSELLSVKLDGLMDEITENFALGLQLDGGKDINGRKLLATCFMFDNTSLLLEMFDTQREVLDEEYYKKHITRIVSRLAQKCFVVSITVDNEASPNAGIDRAIESVPCALHVIHFRCGCHTLELMIESVARSFPWMAACLEKLKAREIVTPITDIMPQVGPSRWAIIHEFSSQKLLQSAPGNVV